MEGQMLDTKVLTEIREEFTAELRNLNKIPSQKPEKPFIISIGGFPGSGKTTAAEILNPLLLGSVHIQSNSARYLLAKRNLPYGNYVHQIIEKIIRNLLVQGYIVIVDGMMTEKEERGLITNAVDDFHAKVSYLAVTCPVVLASERARKRYSDGKPSTFWDWRAKPEKFEEYLKSMQTRKDKLVSEVPSIPNLSVIENNQSKEKLAGALGRFITLIRTQ